MRFHSTSHVLSLEPSIQNGIEDLALKHAFTTFFSPLQESNYKGSTNSSCNLSRRIVFTFTHPLVIKPFLPSSNNHVLISMAVYLVILASALFLPIPASSQLDEFTYTGFNDPKTNMSLNGVALIDKHGVLQLTNDTSRLIGHAFYPSPVRFKNSSRGPVFSFSTCFVFAIHPEYPKLGGHGMAFTIAPNKELKSALPSQYLGLLNSSDVGNFSNHLFAVEFDTVRDFEFGDIDDNHVGIDINSLESNKSAAAGYYNDDSTKTDLNLKSGKPIVAWVEYDSFTNFINVTLSSSSYKPKTPVLSFQTDLSPIFNETMYVGFSASTGLLASSHYVLGWSFKMDGNGGAKSLDLSSLPSVPGTKKKQSSLIIGLSIGAAVFIFASVLLAVVLIRKIKNLEVIESWELEIGPHRYKYQELKKATRGFKDSELLGFGGFGRVYKGTLHKDLVAVKRISHESKQGVREFVSEISTIGRLRHRNLVQLLGWCRRGAELLLVYEFMPNGSLEKFLFDQPKYVLSWAQRVRIIKGVASGLLYLHEGCEQIVIHRDIKASNVLLDADMNGRLGDFGLAKLYDHGSNPSTTRVVGTLGYLAPELPRTGRATTGSDVFAFGTLLLEVTCGRRPIESNAGPEDLVLVDSVWTQWKEGRILDAVDVRMEGDFDEHEAVMMLKLGVMCSSNDQAARPSMRQVVSFLEGEMDIPAGLRPPSPATAGDEKWFEDYVHSYASSSFDKTGSYVDRSFATFSTSPLTLLHSVGEAR